MTKRALYIGGFHLPDKNAAAQRVIGNSKILSELGYTMYFMGICFKENRQKKFTKESYDNLEYYSKPRVYPKSKKKWLKFITSIKDVKEALNTLDELPELIIAYNYPAICLFKLNQYCKKKKIKLIADITEWYLPTGNLLIKTVKTLDSYFRMMYVHKKVNGLIVISRFLSDYYGKEKNIILPPLIDKSSEKWINIDASILNSELSLVYVGSISHGQKDRLDFILSSLARLKDQGYKFKFTIVGLTKEEYIHHYKNTHHKSLDDNVFFLGRKTHNESINFIKKSDFSIFLREKNRLNMAGFPTKFVESIACGTPVITNDTSDLKGYVAVSKVGYIIPKLDDGDLDELLSRVLYMESDEIRQMKKNCKDFNGFHYKNYKHELNNFLSSL